MSQLSTDDWEKCPVCRDSKSRDPHNHLKEDKVAHSLKVFSQSLSAPQIPVVPEINWDQLVVERAKLYSEADMASTLALYNSMRQQTKGLCTWHRCYKKEFSDTGFCFAHAVRTATQEIFFRPPSLRRKPHSPIDKEEHD